MQNTDIARQALVVLREAERRLRELLGRAAANGDYDAAERVTKWSRTLAALALDAENTPSAASTVNNPSFQLAGFQAQRTFGVPPARADGTPSGTALPDAQTRGFLEHAANGRNANDGGTSSDTDVGTQRRPRRVPAKGEYPQFVRRGDNLVKIAWSKKGREEYEHKAPRPAVDALGSAIVRRSANGKLFTVDELLPMRCPDDGREIPGYQVYVALAWFKTVGLVKQHGRRGYTTKNAARLTEAIVASWRQLNEVNS